jgi:putative effector of murein hydrolase LrgA (UPF0299 family)
LLRHLGLFFVPASVLALRQRTSLLAAWMPLLVIIAVSTSLGLLVTGWVTTKLTPRRRNAIEGLGEDEGTDLGVEEESGI